MMRATHAAIGVVCFSLFACQDGGDPGSPAGSGTGFTLIGADPASGIEGIHREPGHLFTLRARFEGTGVTSTISEGSTVLTSLSGPAAVTGDESRWLQSQAASPQGASALSIPDLESLSRVYDRALRGLLSAISPEMRQTPLVVQLTRHRQLLGAILAGQQRALLQEWGTEVSRTLQLQADERSRLAAIFRRYAEQLGRSASAEAKATAQQEIARLLGPSRWSRYQEHRTRWLVTRDPGAHQVSP
jgi:hypothetical protein